MIFNQDGFYKMLIDNSLRRNKFVGNSLIVDYQFADNLFSNSGLVQKIITIPAEDALRAGFLLRGIDETLQEKIFSLLEDLDANKIFSNALSWDRLHGGAGIFMLIDDGGKLSEPVNENKISTIEKLEVYSPEDILPQTFYADTSNKNFGTPEIYTVTNYYGNSFEVHESRMLIFHGGVISNRLRRSRNGWGGTVLEQVESSLTHYLDSLHLSIAALEKLSQDILKLDGMTNLMQNDFGEEQVQKRLQLLDMYKRLENTVAIDSADDFDRKNLSLSGVKDVIEQAENALSAACGIPSTILFGRSPAGMNATGESDFENYYNLVGRIQERSLRPNLMQLIYFLSLANDLKFPEEWSIEFKPLWNLSEKERAETEKLITETQNQKATMFKTLLEIGAMDAEEVRKIIAEDFQLDTSIDKILAEKTE